jgi:D-beta-D-heptose 7-phosphate kinase/D-beta-D-heptose 1-phosphate adenosyltransferase
MGLVLYEDGREPYYLPTALGPDIAVVDPAGAGDTVSAVFALAVTCGAPMREAAFLSDVAGGETVRKLGTATVSRAELLEAVERTALPLPSAGTGL